MQLHCGAAFVKIMKLIFVYNADSGRFNALQDSLHKLISPSTYSCRLCQLTHSFFSEKGEWRNFVDSLDAECVFLHRDEFKEIKNTTLPAAYVDVDGSLKEFLCAEEFAGINSLSELISVIKSKLENSNNVI